MALTEARRNTLSASGRTSSAAASASVLTSLDSSRRSVSYEMSPGRPVTSPRKTVAQSRPMPGCRARTTRGVTCCSIWGSLCRRRSCSSALSSHDRTGLAILQVLMMMMPYGCMVLIPSRSRLLVASGREGAQITRSNCANGVIHRHLPTSPTGLITCRLIYRQSLHSSIRNPASAQSLDSLSR